MVSLFTLFSPSQWVVNHPVVTEHLFSIILEGYISTLDAIEARSQLRGAQGDVRSQPQLVYISYTDYGIAVRAQLGIGWEA
jgi:hypothetical protein